MEPLKRILKRRLTRDAARSLSRGPYSSCRGHVSALCARLACSEGRSLSSREVFDLALYVSRRSLTREVNHFHSRACSGGGTLLRFGGHRTLGCDQQGATRGFTTARFTTGFRIGFTGFAMRCGSFHVSGGRLCQPLVSSPCAIGAGAPCCRSSAVASHASHAIVGRIMNLTDHDHDHDQADHDSAPQLLREVQSLSNPRSRS